MERTKVGEAQFERLVHKIAPQAKLLRTWPLAGGISAQMTALELELPTGYLQKMIVRCFSEHTLQIQPHAAADQFRLLQTTQSLGLHTPKPLFCDPSGEIFGTPCLVVEYIIGNVYFAPLNLSSAMRQFAFQLAQIHSAKVSNHDLSFLYKRSNVCVEIRQPPPGQRASG